MFTPRKLDPVALSGPGRLWGYLQGGHEYADYYLARDGTPTEAAVELHGKLVARLGLDQLDRPAFERLAAGCHPLTGKRLIKTSHALRRDRATGELITRGGAHVPGIDCNLSPPKSVSAILPFVSAADRAALEAAHLAAVRVTVRELEQRVARGRSSSSAPPPRRSMPVSWPRSSSGSATAWTGTTRVRAEYGSWPGSTSRCWSCSPAATATSTSSPPGSRRRRAGRRPSWSAAAWPSRTGWPRRPPVGRRTGPPIARSSTVAAWRHQSRSVPCCTRLRRVASGRPRYGRGCSARTGSPIR